MTLCDIAEDREQWRDLVALASMAGNSWMMNTLPDSSSLEPISELRRVTCHIIQCHLLPAQVNVPHLNPSQAGH